MQEGGVHKLSALLLFLWGEGTKEGGDILILTSSSVISSNVPIDCEEKKIRKRFYHMYYTQKIILLIKFTNDRDFSMELCCNTTLGNAEQKWNFMISISMWNRGAGGGGGTREKLYGGSGQFRPRNAILKEPSKIKKEPLKIAIDCNVKACSMLQI